jgi:hypothetical protein
MSPCDPVRRPGGRRVLLSVALAALVACPALGQDSSPSPGIDGTAVPHDVQLRQLKALEQRLMWKGARRHFVQAAQKTKELKAAKRGKAIKPGARATRPVGEDYPVPENSARHASPSGALATSSTAAVPTNVRVNDPTGDLSTSSCQSEESIAFLGNDILVAWNDSQGFSTGGDVQGWGYSTDGGATFIDGGSIPHPAGYASWIWTSDPVVTVNAKTGRFYYCGLTDPDASHNGIGVAYGHFSGTSFAWDSVVLVRSASNATNFLDKEWFFADSSSNYVYLSNTTFTNTNWIDFYRSSDGGATWSSAAQISQASDNGYVQGSRPTVGPNGEVYVTWMAINQTVDANDFKFRKSVDHGLTFSAEIPLASYMDQYGTGSPGFNRERGIGFPSITVDRTTGPNRGRIHAAWGETWDILGQTFYVNTGKVEVESNNTTATATLFTPGQTLRGTVTTGNPTDYDYWKFALTAGQTVVFWADSLSSKATYTLRLFAPTPDDAQRLAFGAESDSTVSSPGHSYFSFTAPVAGTYFLRMAPYYTTSRLFRYRILTAFGTPGSGYGRDTRDVFACWSDNGTAWSAPVRVNDDGIGFDEFLPEVAVGADGCPYVTWFDYREDTYGSRCQQYASRSLDGGTTWQTNAKFTSAAGNFTTSLSNMAPNMGDYSSTLADDRYVRPVWADGRGSNPDTWETAIDTWHSLGNCPADQNVDVDDVVSLSWAVNNLNPLFANNYSYTLTDTRGWPLPAPGTLTSVPAAGSANLDLSVTVPDTVSSLGPDVLTLSVWNEKNTLVQQCSMALNVVGPLNAGPAFYTLALAPVRPNPASGLARLQYTLPREGTVRLRIYGLQGEVVRTLADGTRGAGVNSAVWDGRDESGRTVAAGAYFARLEAFGRTLTQRLIWMR